MFVFLYIICVIIIGFLKRQTPQEEDAFIRTPLRGRSKIYFSTDVQRSTRFAPKNRSSLSTPRLLISEQCLRVDFGMEFSACRKKPPVLSGPTIKVIDKMVFVVRRTARKVISRHIGERKGSWREGEPHRNRGGFFAVVVVAVAVAVVLWASKEYYRVLPIGRRTKQYPLAPTTYDSLLFLSPYPQSARGFSGQNITSNKYIYIRR